MFSNNSASNPNESKAASDKEMTLPGQIIAIVLNAIEQGKISTARIDESYQRIIQARSRLNQQAVA